jgi:hypothetical protein
LARGDPLSIEAPRLLFQGVVAPIHQRVAPLGVLDIVLGPLPAVALDVAVDALHVLDVVVGVVGLVFAPDLDDPAPRLVALGLAPSSLWPTDLDSSVCSHSSSSLGAMLTASYSWMICCLSSATTLPPLLGLAQRMRLVGGLLAALLALDEIARAVLGGVDLLPAEDAHFYAKAERLYVLAATSDRFPT